MIRQAISCDICGAEKKQTNHWFVVCEQAGELRIGGWSSRNRLRAGSKHLCGQTCLHKLVDEFMARTIAGRPAAHVPHSEHLQGESEGAGIDTSLTSSAAYADESSAQLILPEAVSPAACLSALSVTPPATVVTMPARTLGGSPAPIAVPLSPEEPLYSSRRWRAEAWERERSRELRSVERHPDILRRRKGL